MQNFKLGQQVRVLAEVQCVAPPPSSAAQDALAGKTGTVVRLRRADDAAWVRMDCDLPRGLRTFPVGDEGGRDNHIILWPRECCAVRKTPNVRAKRATTVGRQARAGENVPRTARPGLVACRWRSA